MEMMMKRSKLSRLVHQRLSRNLMSFMKTTMMCGQIEMKVKTINKPLIQTWLRMKSCQNYKMSTRRKLMN